MRIPLVPVSGRRETFVSGRAVFEGGVPRIERRADYTASVREAYSACADTRMMAVLDVDGLAGRDMNTDLLKSKRVKGRTVMLITHVSTEDDVLDGLCGNFDVLGIPYHTADRGVMECALELSDTAAPVVFMRSGRELSTGRSADSVRAEMRGIGFGRIALLDTDGLTADYLDSAETIPAEIESIS